MGNGVSACCSHGDNGTPAFHSGSTENHSCDVSLTPGLPSGVTLSFLGHRNDISGQETKAVIFRENSS